MTDLMKITRPSDIPKFDSAIDEFQRLLITVALDACQGHRGRTADALGIHRNSLTRLCAEHRIPKDYGLPKAGLS